MEAKKLVDGEGGVLPSVVRVAEADFLKRRIIRGKALSTGAITLFALSAPRSVVSGKTFSPREFMSEFNSDRFAPIIPLDDVRAALNEDIDNPRILANVVVLSARDLEEAGEEEYMAKFVLRSAARDESSADGGILASQVISGVAAEALKAKNYRLFLTMRARDLRHRAVELTKKTQM
jgi:hypothetical protein